MRRICVLSCVAAMALGALPFSVASAASGGRESASISRPKKCKKGKVMRHHHCVPGKGGKR